MCASAPALKVFFRRYFHMSTVTNSYSRSGTGKTPIPLSRSRGQASGHSMTTSRAEHSGSHEPALFQGIKVSQGLDIHVEERDDISQKSFASTRNLTKSEDKGYSAWSQGCRTVCAAFTPSTRDSSRNRDNDRDIELGPTRG
jgi:hypothetical protein